MNDDGSINEQYEIANDEESWKGFGSRYIELKPEIALEVSTTRKYAARMLRDMGFSVHIADTIRLALIFNTAKKNDKEDVTDPVTFRQHSRLPHPYFMICINHI